MEILGSVLLVAIILGSITAAYMWGLPLINKSGDASRIEYAKTVFEKLSDSFAKVAREGGQSSLDIQMDRGVFRLERDQANEYVLAYTMQTDLKFFSTTEVPINDFNSPYMLKEGWIKVTATGVCSGGAPVGCDKPETLDLGEDGSYQVCICADGSLFYSGTKYNKGDQFGGNTNYKVQDVNYADGVAGVSDGYTTVVGLLGVDKAGVIMAKMRPAGTLLEMVMKLKPRKLFDPSNSEILELNLVGAKGASTIGRGSFTLNMKNAGETIRTEQVTIDEGTGAKSGVRKVRTVTIEIGFSS